MDTTVRTIGGRYRLLEPLGSGGMGTVWRAEDLVLAREVAVKEVAPPHGVSDAEQEVLRERTRREARAAARLDHPCAVTVYDVVEEDDRPYLVMELVEAPTLSELVRSSGPLSPQRAAQVGLDVLGALQAAHVQGIVHRDVKPGNVLIREDGRVVLTDFGIATSTGDSSITSTGLLLGSPSYIAPERARGETPGPASDLWSLGATLFTAVEGRPPFDGGEPLLTVTAVVTGEHAPFVAAGPLEDVLEGLLEKDPARRLGPDQARAMLQEVASSAATTPLPSAPQPAAEQRAGGTQALPLGAVHDRATEAAQEQAAEEQAAQQQAADDAAGRSTRGGPRPVPLRSGTAAAPRRSGRLATGIAAAVLAAVGIAGYGLTSDRGFDLNAPSGTSDDDGSGTSGDGSDEGSDDKDAARPAAAPAGWKTYDGPAGSQLAVPPAYRPGPFDGITQYKDQASGRTLRVTTVERGKDDAVRDRREQAAAFDRTHDDYREIRIEKADYRGLEAADWEFTYRSGRAALHAVNRVFVTPDGRGWSLFFQTRGGDDWPAARADFDRIAASFRPG